ncbi:MAG: hypothetical protein P4L36_07270 [Holophaga sp.]|nr:hypothetical protein [Holophaga sp.]
MRFSFLVPALLLTGVLASASPWGDFVQRRRQDPRLGKWTVCVRQGDFPNFEAYKDPTFQKLLTAGDCNLEPLAGALAQDLWSQKSWGSEPHWLLLSPTGDEAGSGPGRPKGDQVLDAIHAVGARPRWEARDQFLREHPDQGEARLEALNQAFQILRVRLLALDREGKVHIPAWHTDPSARPSFTNPRVSLAPGRGDAMADELYAEVADALEQLISLPGWEREAGAVASHLGFYDVGQSSRMRKLCARAAASLEQRLREDPYDQDLAHFWVETMDAAGLPLGNLAGLCLPVPGDPWPDPGMLSRFLEPSYRRRDWNGALRLVSDLTPQGPPEPMSPHGWDNYCRLQSALLAQRGIAMAGLGTWDLAGSALGEARQWGGSQGVRDALLSRGSLFTGPGGDPNAWRLLVTQVLGRDGEPPAMPALAPPLRLVVNGMPRWLLAWTALRGAPELAPWSPAELRWEVADREAFDKARARFGWAPGPRWALYRGEELRATGSHCPEAKALASVLEGEGPTLLQRLQGLLASQPDHLAARRERVELLMKRMPDRRLEPILAEDAARARVALEFDPKSSWRPDPSLWGAAAQQALPALEQAIRVWPNRTYLWRAWISWARFHPSQPSVLALAQNTAFWSPRGDWRSWLPYEVQRAVAAELKRQGNFSVMRDWFRAVWDTLDHRPLDSLYRGEQSWVLERRREEQTAVFQPLRDALTALDCTQEQAELERVFGEMMGRAPGRR